MDTFDIDALAGREAEARAKQNETTTLEPLLERIGAELVRVKKALESVPGDGPMDAPVPSPKAPD